MQPPAWQPLSEPHELLPAASSSCATATMAAGHAAASNQPSVAQVRAYDRAAAAAYHAEQGVPTMAIDRIAQVVMEPLSEADRPKRAAFRSKVC